MTTKTTTSGLLADLRTALRGANESGHLVWARLFEASIAHIERLDLAAGPKWDDAEPNGPGQLLASHEGFTLRIEGDLWDAMPILHQDQVQVLAKEACRIAALSRTPRLGDVIPKATVSAPTFEQGVQAAIDLLPSLPDDFDAWRPDQLREWFRSSIETRPGGRTGLPPATFAGADGLPHLTSIRGDDHLRSIIETTRLNGVREGIDKGCSHWTKVCKALTLDPVIAQASDVLAAVKVPAAPKAEWPGFDPDKLLRSRPRGATPLREIIRGAAQAMIDHDRPGDEVLAIAGRNEEWRMVNLMLNLFEALDGAAPAVGDNPGIQEGAGYHPEGATGLAQPTLHGTPGHPARTYVIRSEGGPEIVIRGWLDPLCMTSSDRPERKRIELADEVDEGVRPAVERVRPPLRSTHTLAVLEVRPEAYRGVWNALTVAGDTSRFEQDGSIDMTGLLLAALPGRE